MSTLDFKSLAAVYQVRKQMGKRRKDSFGYTGKTTKCKKFIME